jgi:hypothetical protein
MFGFTSLKDWTSMSGGSLLGDPRPEGFDDRGRHVLNDVGEFRLVEMWAPGGERVIECREDIQAALDQALFCISDARDGVSTPGKRVRLAGALDRIREAAIHGKAALSATETLGLEIDLAIHGPDVEIEINTLAAELKAAMRSVAIANGRLPGKDGKKRKLKPEAVAILEARRIFETTGDRPTKSAIRAAMGTQGMVFKGRNAPSKWREVFFRARLHELAE